MTSGSGPSSQPESPTGSHQPDSSHRGNRPPAANPGRDPSSLSTIFEVASVLYAQGPQGAARSAGASQADPGEAQGPGQFRPLDIAGRVPGRAKEAPWSRPTAVPARSPNSPKITNRLIFIDHLRDLIPPRVTLTTEYRPHPRRLPNPLPRDGSACRTRNPGHNASPGRDRGSHLHISHSLPTLPIFGPAVLLRLTGLVRSEFMASL